MNHQVTPEAIHLCDDSVKLSDRITRLIEQYHSIVPPLCVERARLLTETYRQTESKPHALRRALALENILNHIGIFMCDDDMLLGAIAEKRRGSSVFPEFGVQFIENELTGNPVDFSTRPYDPYIVEPEVRRELLEDILPYWKDRCEEALVYSQLPAETMMANEKGVGGYDGTWITRGGDGHIIPDWEKLLRIGVNGVIRQIEEHMAALDLADPNDYDRYIFYQSALIVNKAVVSYAQRLSRMAEERAAATTDPTVKKHLLQLAEINRRVPAQPARTFHEGLQAITTVISAIQLESNGHGVCVGRLDQLLYPYYKQELEAGTLTQESAMELVCALYIKLNEQSKLRDIYDTKPFVGYMTYPNLTIAGQDDAGRDGVNDLSYICVAATKKSRLIQPLLAVRVFNGTSHRFMQECAKCVGTGIGYPAFYNDEAIIPAMMAVGYSLDDARGYGIVGCVEPSIPGKCSGRYGAAFPNPVKVLECTINGGTDPRTGLTPLPCKRLSEMSSWEEFYNEFKAQELHYLKHHVIQDNCIDKVYEQYLQTPLLSSYVQDCIGRGKELKQGGGVYAFTGGQMCGTSCAINCLCALKQLVFTDKLLTPVQLEHALATNFEDSTTSPTGEEIRQLLLTRAPKFGNDDDVSNEIGSDFVGFWAKNKMSFHNTLYGRGPIGGRFVPSTATVAANVPMGEYVGATPDGRKAGTPLSEGISAFGGSDIEGPTALANSVAQLPNELMIGGQLLNIKFNPAAFTSEQGIQNFLALLKGYFDKKGFQMQINVVDKATLLEAQHTPENYRDLMVRVAGYSAYFVSIDKDLQNDIIRRTEHNV